MFTDIVGSTGLRDDLVAANGERDGNRLYGERYLEPHNALIRALLEKHRGFEVKTAGDAFMVAFASPEDAVVCAAEIQRSLRDDAIVPVRIGMHTGAAMYVERDGKPDYDGHAVNIAARVEGLLKGGERIYCSRETAALAKTPPDIRFHSYGPYLLKGVSGKVEIFEVMWDEAIVPAAPLQQEALPYPWLTPWVGREREMTMLEEALRSARLVTLHGTGGVGKTRMAVQTLLARGSGLPRELVFVSLEKAADSASGLLGAVRDALGLTEADAADYPTLCRQLHGSDRLLILDNFESVMRDAGSVSAIAATPGMRVLVTSQQMLDVNGERVVKLDTMATQGDLATLESYRLFTGLAQQRDAIWQPNDDGAMREVLQATDGLPYLIELVAAVAHKRTLRQLADELKTRLDGVRARTHDGARKPQHESVQACLEWALGRLPAEERDALPRLAIFAGGFDAEAAEAIAATPLASVDVLVDASLLRFDRETGRYSMLSTTRQFGRGFLASEAWKLIAASHARWFIERLERAVRVMMAKGGEAQKDARHWIDIELENIQQAVASAEKEEPGLYEIAAAAFPVYLRQVGRFSDDLRLQEEQLRRLDPETRPLAWARTQANLGNAYWNLRTGDQGENLTKAIACYEAALRVYREQDFPNLWALTQNNLGNAYGDLPTGDREENVAKAIGCYEAALRVYNERDFPVDWAMTQNNLGATYDELLTGDRAKTVMKAIACYEAALRVYNERDFPLGWAISQNNLGNAYCDVPTSERSENLAKAIVCYEAALRVYNERDFPVGWATTQNNLGSTYVDLPTGDRAENLAKAIACYEGALRISTEKDFKLEWAKAQRGLGNAYGSLPIGDQGESLAKTIACYEAAASGFSEVGLTEDAEWARQSAARAMKDSKTNKP